MAGQGGGKQSYLKNYILKNKIFKILLYMLFFFFFFFIFIFIIDKGLNGTLLIKYNNLMRFISYCLNELPIYNKYTQYFNRYTYFQNYQYNINQGLIISGNINRKYIDFMGKLFFELLPFFFSAWFFMPKFSPMSDNFKDYNKQLKWRNLKAIPNPIRELEATIANEGTNGEKLEEFNPYEVEVMKNLYMGSDMYKNIYKDDVEGYKGKVPGLYDIYEERLRVNMEKYLFEESNLIYNEEFGKKINRELYFPSIKREVSFEELFRYYQYALKFLFAKQSKNFSMHDYTINLDCPREIKKLCKWMVGRNAPGIIFVPDNPNVPIREAKMKPSELYYRIYRIRNYIGMDADYMKKFIKLIEENRNK